MGTNICKNFIFILFLYIIILTGGTATTYRTRVTYQNTKTVAVQNQRPSSFNVEQNTIVEESDEEERTSPTLCSISSMSLYLDQNSKLNGSVQRVKYDLLNRGGQKY